MEVVAGWVVCFGSLLEFEVSTEQKRPLAAWSAGATTNHIYFIRPTTTDLPLYLSKASMFNTHTRRSIHYLLLPLVANRQLTREVGYPVRSNGVPTISNGSSDAAGLHPRDWSAGPCHSPATNEV
jgi:hypothetical protein